MLIICQMKRLRRDMYIRENCHPAKTTVLAWVQIPMWVSLSLALRNMAGALPIKGTGKETNTLNNIKPCHQTSELVEKDES